MSIAADRKSLSELTSIQVGGFAEEFHEPRSTEALQELLTELKDREPFILGGGCNTLFPDGQFPRPVISTAKMRELEVRGDGTLTAEAGVRIDALIRAAMKNGLAGLEGFVGIPGSVGGAVVMNAGGSGWSFGEHVEELGLISADGSEFLQVSASEVPWSYRSWNFPGGYIVAWAKLRLEPGSPTEIRQRAVEFLRKKNRTQPLGKPSAGCIFKNPPGMYAAAMIEELGWKGRARGGAMISPRHANFIVNEAQAASASDVLELVEDIRRDVLSAFGVQLETEVVLAGGRVPPPSN